MMDIMTKNKIIWKDGIPCIALDAGAQHFIGIAPPIPSDIGRPIRGSKRFEPGIYENIGPQRPPFLNEVWEFKIEFLPPDFTSLQEQKELLNFEDILKDLEEFFEGD